VESTARDRTRGEFLNTTFGRELRDLYGASRRTNGAAIMKTVRSHGQTRMSFELGGQERRERIRPIVKF